MDTEPPLMSSSCGAAPLLQGAALRAYSSLIDFTTKVSLWTSPLTSTRK